MLGVLSTLVNEHYTVFNSVTHVLLQIENKQTGFKTCPTCW